MSELATLGTRYISEGAEQAVRDLDQYAGKARTAEQASDAAAGGSRRMSAAMQDMVESVQRAERELAEAARHERALAQAADLAAASTVNLGRAAAQMGPAMSKAGKDAQAAAVGFDTFYDAAQRDFATQYVRQMGGVSTVHGKAAATSKQLSLASLDLSRQLADVGVTAAMGMNPLMILIQQGPQIADRLAMMKMEGIGVGAAFRGMAAAAAPAMAVLGPLAVVAAGIGLGFAVAAKEINDANKDMIDGLGLTEAQLDRVKNKSVTMGDVMTGTWRATAKAFSEAFASEISAVQKAFNAWYDELIVNTVKEIKTIVGGFVGAYEVIKATWSGLPAAIGDVAVQATNAVIGAVEAMINRAIDAYNKLLPVIRATLQASGNGAAAMALRPGSAINLGRAENEYAGSMRNLAEAGTKAFSEGMAKGAKAVDAALSAISKESLAAARERILKEAGKPAAAPTARAPRDPRDMNDEAVAQSDRLLAQALAEELQARAALTDDVRSRAAIEKDMIAAQMEALRADLERQAANLADRKGISEATRGILELELEATRLTMERVGGLRMEKVDRDAQRATIQEQTRLAEAELSVRRATLDAQGMLARSSFGRAAIAAEIQDIDHQIERLKAEEAVSLAEAGSVAEREAKLRLQAVTLRQSAESELLEREGGLINAITEAADAAGGFGSAFRRHDWARAFDELQRTIEIVQMSFQKNGMTGGVMTLGSVAAQAIGGKTGNAIGGGLGIAGMGIAAGSSLMTAASMGMLGSGIGAGLGMTIAPLLGPIGIAAGALYAAAKLLNVGGKPSNAGAGVDMVTGAISGNRRTDETEQAAKSAADAIKGIEDSLKAAGIGLEDSVRGLVLGTRDQTQIYLQSGKTLTSAVGDSGAAVDTALRALLEGADYVSEAQEKLVQSALDAGKGFDEISKILASYEAAQAISGNLADQILRLTDPKAFDTQAVKRDAEAQREAAQAAADAGYITASQLEEINKQLATLEGLNVADVAKRYGASNDNALDQAKDVLLDSYHAFAEAKGAEIAALRQTADALHSFRKELDYGAIAGRDPVSQYIATKREFDRLNAMAENDPERVANFQAVSQAFVEASRAASPTQLAFERDLNAVRRATEASEDIATQQADAAQAQLDAATAQLQQLGLLNMTTLSMADALNQYLAAAQMQKATAAANDNAFDAATYLAANPDLGANWAAGGSLHQLGSTIEEAVRRHFEIAGVAEGRKGGGRLPAFAAGGDHWGGLRVVGEEGPEIEATGPARYFNAGQTAQMLGRDNSEVVAELRSLRAEVAAIRSEASKTAENTKSMDQRGKRQELFGAFVRGETPDDPVDVKVAS